MFRMLVGIATACLIAVSAHAQQPAATSRLDDIVKRGIGRNPRTGKEVRIPPGRTIRFKPDKDLQNIG